MEAGGRAANARPRPRPLDDVGNAARSRPGQGNADDLRDVARSKPSRQDGAKRAGPEDPNPRGSRSPSPRAAPKAKAAFGNKQNTTGWETATSMDTGVRIKIDADGMERQVSSDSEMRENYLRNMGKQVKTNPDSWGVSNIVVCEHTGVPQVLSYDIRSLITFGGVLNMWARGTIFRDQYALRWYFLVHFGGLVFCIGLVMLFFSEYEAMSTESIERLAWYLNFAVPLVLGLYLGVSLERWWTLRVSAIGNLCDCSLDITQQVAAYLPDQPEVTARVNKWSMASVVLLMNAARNNHDLSDMIKNGYLEDSEALALDGIALYGRAMVMWAWIARIGNEAMVKCKGPEPYSNHLYVMLDVCVKARRSIQTIHTYLQTALPFAYVHIVAFLVDAMVTVTTIKCSLVCVRAWHQEPKNYQHMVYETVAFVALPFLYHGLMSVTYVISDPFGDDMADFPISTFEKWSQDQVDAAVMGVDKFPWAEWELLSGQPQSAESKAAALAAAARQAARARAGLGTDVRPCAGGCGFKITWHHTHCCSRCFQESGKHDEKCDKTLVNIGLQEEVDEDTEGVVSSSAQAATAIMRDATIEVTVNVKRALRGLTQELKIMQEKIERSTENRAKDTEILLEKLAARAK